MFGIDDAIGGALIGGAISALGTDSQNSASMDRLNAANAFSADQFATRYQTTVKDMQAAGLNPMLAYSQGGGSPPTSAAPPPVMNPASAGVATATNTYAAARAGELQKAQSQLVDAQKGRVEAETNNLNADSEQKRSQIILNDITGKMQTASAGASQANTNFLETQAESIKRSMANIPKEGNRLDVLAQQLSSSRDLMIKQGATQEQIRNQTEWLARKTMLEGDLTSLDVDAAKNFNNFGRNAGQLKPIFDIIRGILVKH